MNIAALTNEVPSRELGPRILFVDDSPDERELFPLRFRSRFSSIVAVGSVDDALDELRRGETELVCSDISLPAASGLDLVGAMREMAPEIGGAVPALAVTGLGAADDLDRAYAAGFSGYLIKPYDNAELLSVVERVGPSISALRRIRERCQASQLDQLAIRRRLATRHIAIEEQRARLTLAHAGPDPQETEQRLCVVETACRFAEAHFDRPVDEVEIAAAKVLADGVSSWVAIAVCDRELLFVEVLDGASTHFTARRLDT